MNIADLIKEKRTKLGLTQKDFADALGMGKFGDRTLRRWENGESKPAVNQLLKLSKVFDVSIDVLIDLDEKQEKQINKIVITGGPCAGKSTALAWIQAEYTKKGYAVIFVPESATELIMGGISSVTLNSNLEFQTAY